MTRACPLESSTLLKASPAALYLPLAKDVNALLEQIQPRYFLPIHLSKTYLGRSDELYRELSLSHPQTSLFQ